MNRLAKLIARCMHRVRPAPVIDTTLRTNDDTLHPVADYEMLMAAMFDEHARTCLFRMGSRWI